MKTLQRMVEIKIKNRLIWFELRPYITCSDRVKFEVYISGRVMRSMECHDTNKHRAVKTTVTLLLFEIWPIRRI